MEFIFSRYRNLTVLLVVIVAQLVLIAYQVKTSKDVPLIRVWAVTTVTPIEQVLETVRRNTSGFVENYFVLLRTRKDNETLRQQLNRLKLENQYLASELSRADRARALIAFQAHSQSKTLAAQIIGNAAGANSKAVFIDRGSTSGVEAGMAVVTPDGIVAKVVAAYPTASLILLLTDANFAAGVISQNNSVHGTVKGQGHDGTLLVDYIQNEEKVDIGEWFYTSGEDRVFPRGFPVGQVTTIRNGAKSKEVYVTPSGLQSGLQEVLVVLRGVHQEIPSVQIASAGYKLLAPPAEKGSGLVGFPQETTVVTEADRLKEQYRQVGVAEKHVFGDGVPGSPPPDFTKMGLPKTDETAANAQSPTTPAAPLPGLSREREQAGVTAPAAPVKGAGNPAIAVVKPTTPGTPATVGANGVKTVPGGVPATASVAANGVKVPPPTVPGTLAKTAVPTVAPNGVKTPPPTTAGVAGKAVTPTVAANGVKTTPTTAPAAGTSASNLTANAGTTPPPAIAAKPKPRLSGPLLVTDPTDADPTEAAPPPAPSRPERASRPNESELNEFGEPKQQQKTVSKRAISVDGSTEILPPAPPPRSRTKPVVDKTTDLLPRGATPLVPRQPSGAAVPPRAR